MGAALWYHQLVDHTIEPQVLTTAPNFVNNMFCPWCGRSSTTRAFPSLGYAHMAYELATCSFELATPTTHREHPRRLYPLMVFSNLPKQ